MKSIYVFRNTAIEYLFSNCNNNYIFSSYGDINIPEKDYDAYLFFYMIPHKFDRKSLIEEIKNYYEKINYLLKNKTNENFYIMTLYPFWETNFVYSDRSFENEVDSFNKKIYELQGNVKVIQIKDFCSSINNNSLIDMKYYYLYNAVINPRYKDSFSKFIDKEIKKYEKVRKKCLVLDLDNTLWNGIIGEDGILNVEMGGEYPGNAYADFQRLILELKRNGVILCVASKNNKEDVEELFKMREDMILKKDDFVIIEASWNDKSKSINKIAEILNIGLSDIVFIDDDPMQRELVKNTLKEVNVLDFPNEPFMLTEFFSTKFKELFSIDRVTDDDLDKTNQYKAKMNADETKSQFNNIDDFIESLNMEIEIELLNEKNITRIEELINKSNQFNLTTKRYDKSILTKMKKESLIYAMKVKDKFDDLGIVGVSIIIFNQDIAEIDTFLLSCRVIGRKVENKFMEFIFNVLKEKKCKEVISRYVKTAKNSQVKDFYSDFGFDIIEQNGDETLYRKKIECEECL